jgi:hypothetical protein
MRFWRFRGPKCESGLCVSGSGRIAAKSPQISTGTWPAYAKPGSKRESYQVSGVIIFSSPVFDEQGYAVAALSVPFIRCIKDHITPKDVRRHIQEASREISREVGGK